MNCSLQMMPRVNTGDEDGYIDESNRRKRDSFYYYLRIHVHYDETVYQLRGLLYILIAVIPVNLTSIMMAINTLSAGLLYITWRD